MQQSLRRVHLAQGVTASTATTARAGREGEHPCGRGPAPRHRRRLRFGGALFAGDHRPAQLGRVFTSVPEWTLTQMNRTATAATDPESLHDEGVSDHAPPQVTFRPRPQRSHAEQLIPRFARASRERADAHQLSVARSSLKHDRGTAPIQKCKEPERMMREAARIARHKFISASSPSP